MSIETAGDAMDVWDDRPRLVLGLWLGGAAGILWIAAAVVYRGDLQDLLSLGVTTVGFVVAALAERNWRPGAGSIGLLLVAGGIIWNYRGDLWSTLDRFGALLFVTGVMVAAWGTHRVTGRPQRIGFGLAAIASLLWVFTAISWPWWQAGCILMLVATTAATIGSDAPRLPESTTLVSGSRDAPEDSSMTTASTK